MNNYVQEKNISTIFVNIKDCFKELFIANQETEQTNENIIDIGKIDLS